VISVWVDVFYRAQDCDGGAGQCRENYNTLPVPDE
jgi:hypothetical protein